MAGFSLNTHSHSTCGRKGLYRGDWAAKGQAREPPAGHGLLRPVQTPRRATDRSRPTGRSSTAGCTASHPSPGGTRRRARTSTQTTCRQTSSARRRGSSSSNRQSQARQPRHTPADRLPRRRSRSRRSDPARQCLTRRSRTTRQHEVERRARHQPRPNRKTLANGGCRNHVTWV